MLGGLAGLAIAFLRHMQDRSVRLPRHIRDTASIECLGEVARFAEPNVLRHAKEAAHDLAKYLRFKSIPRVLSRSTTALDCFDEVSKSPYSAFATSLTAVQTAMRLASRKLPVQCVGITSPFPGDGKTTLSVNLAALFARIGLRVLVIDCDIRKSSLSAELAPDVDYGLLEVLADSALIESAKVHAELQNIDVLPLCNVTSARDAFAAMGSENMRKLLVSESKLYDIIVVDLPALKTDFEALNIIALLDGIVLTVSWGNTSMEVLAEVAHMLRTAKAKIMGAVINKVGALSSDSYSRQAKSIY
jgi:capsular exopolysaccharide synthesis family protein